MGRIVKAHSLSCGSSQYGYRIANIEKALQTEELDLQSLSSLVYESAKLRFEFNCLRSSFKALGSDMIGGGGKKVTLFQDVHVRIAVHKKKTD